MKLVVSHQEGVGTDGLKGEEEGLGATGGISGRGIEVVITETAAILIVEEI